MQFRIMGKRIQCLRTCYNPERKMGEQKLVVSIDAGIEALPADLSELSALDTAELEQLRQWLFKRKTEQDLAKAQKAIATAPDAIEQIQRAITGYPDNLTAAHAKTLLSATQNLIATLQNFTAETPQANRPAQSVFAEFKDEISALKAKGKTVKQILEYLQAQYPEQMESLSYNGLRSYIRRHFK